jgi:hypothetical protein
VQLVETCRCLPLLLLLLQVLGRGHAIKSLEKCDFTPIYDHLMAERDKKKALTKEVQRQQQQWQEGWQQRWRQCNQHQQRQCNACSSSSSSSGRSATASAPAAVAGWTNMSAAGCVSVHVSATAGCQS